MPAAALPAPRRRHPPCRRPVPLSALPRCRGPCPHPHPHTHRAPGAGAVPWRQTLPGSCPCPQPLHRCRCRCRRSRGLSWSCAAPERPPAADLSAAFPPPPAPPPPALPDSALHAPRQGPLRPPPCRARRTGRPVFASRARPCGGPGLLLRHNVLCGKGRGAQDGRDSEG